MPAQHLFNPQVFDRSIHQRQSILKYTNALRLVNGKSDGCVGLTIDQYNRHFVIQLFDSGWKASLEEITNYLEKRFQPEFIIAKWRISSDGRSLDHPQMKVLMDKSPAQTVVQEYGLQFKVDLNDTINSGLFLDMRANRKLAASQVKGKSVLNCFAYTCSFGVHSKAAGAVETINIDISKKILEKGKENYQLNQLEVLPQEFLVRDSESYLKSCLKKDKRFDCIILDPPSFSRYEGRVMSIKKDFPKLIGLALKILAPKGILFLSTNCSQISYYQLMMWVKELSFESQKKIGRMDPLKQGDDFNGTGDMKESYLVGYLVRYL